jgi:hypothetical protein
MGASGSERAKPLLAAKIEEPRHKPEGRSEQSEFIEL